MSELPHTRIYPLRVQVLQALSKAFDDPKKAVRQEAVRCRQAWRQLHQEVLICEEHKHSQTTLVFLLQGYQVFLDDCPLGMVARDALATKFAKTKVDLGIT
ncbi:uncharacterized protein LOC110638879 isoform X5 [Hevea brasiliensis]|uniref:uncharacterized protein LOC110638879 isoform X5 n=1 Tax=Hevea brasiliensis TaxID=3981 RepID=UPI0025F95A74|nr:uncharacterized protein LOC110638879 isoform X5 [Hevea brasiliensis]XP_058006225.1 uncharacterized protein LOC110638879 isoform X5 [Hevea brasiliensis]